MVGREGAADCVLSAQRPQHAKKLLLTTSCHIPVSLHHEIQILLHDYDVIQHE